MSFTVILLARVIDVDKFAQAYVKLFECKMFRYIHLVNCEPREVDYFIIQSKIISRS